MIDFKKETIEKIVNYLEKNSKEKVIENFNDEQTRCLMDRKSKIINLNCAKKVTGTLTTYNDNISLFFVDVDYNIKKYPFEKESLVILKRDMLPILTLRTTEYERMLIPSIKENHVIVPKGFKGRFYSKVSAIYNERNNLVLYKKDAISDENLVLFEDFQRGDEIQTIGLSLLSTANTISVEYSSHSQQPVLVRNISENGSYEKIGSNSLNLIVDELNAITDSAGKIISNGMEKHLSLK